MNKQGYANSKVMYCLKYCLLLVMAVLLTGCSSSNYGRKVVFLDGNKEQKYINAYNETLSLWPVPFEEMDISTSYGTAHIIVSGPKNGMPLVLLHGMDASSTMWYPNVANYAKKYRVYAIDYLLEPGKSVAKVKKMDNDEICEWYNEIFNKLNLKKFSLIGNSRGGWLATNYTIKNLGRVDKLILLAPVQTFSMVNMGLSTRGAANFKFFPNRDNLDELITTFSRHPEKLDDKFKEQLYLGTKYSRSNFSLLGMSPFSDDELMTLALPVLVLVGDHDVLNDIDIIEKSGKLLPNVEAAVIDDAAHFLTLDKQEEVDKRIIDFLDKKHS